MIEKSGYKLKAEFSGYDAEIIFDLPTLSKKNKTECIAGEILRDLKIHIPVKCLVGSVHLQIRWVHQWYHQKVLVLHTINIKYKLVIKFVIEL